MEEKNMPRKGENIYKRKDAGKPDTFIHSKKMEVPDTVLSMQQII